MNHDEAFGRVVDLLDAAGVASMIVGSFSSNFYGVPRATQDADLVVAADAPLADALAKGLPEGFTLDPQMGFELVTGMRRWKLIGRQGFHIEIFLLSDDPHDQARFARRVRVRMLGREVAVPAAEDVLITKLRWYERAGREKDRSDALGLMAVQGDRLDWDYVEHWCAQHDTSALLRELEQELQGA